MAYSIKKFEVIDYPASDLNEFHIYCYEWIDNLHFILPPKNFLPLPEEQLDKYLNIAREKFSSAGSDGEGEIGLLWLPPFVFKSELNVSHLGILVWHVKQTDDGISWLLSPIELPFERFHK